MGEKLRVIARVVSLTRSLARSAASGAACTILCAGAGWTGMALAQEEATVAQRPAANTNTISFQMRPVTADLSNSDEQRINADADQDNWRLHGRTYDNQRFSPLTQINASNVKELKPVALDPDRCGELHGNDADRDRRRIVRGNRRQCGPGL
jgi:glucose dehydrogenase